MATKTTQLILDIHGCTPIKPSLGLAQKILMIKDVI